MFETISIFLSSSSSSSARGNAPLLIVFIEGLGFILLGFLVLYISFSYVNHIFLCVVSFCGSISCYRLSHSVSPGYVYNPV